MFPDEARGLPVEGQLAHAAPQASLVPRPRVDPQEEPVGDDVMAPLAHLARPLWVEVNIGEGELGRREGVGKRKESESGKREREEKGKEGRERW